MKKSLTLLLLTFTLAAAGQQKKLDSLYQALKHHLQEDTARVKIILAVGDIELNGNHPDTLLILMGEALRISKEKEFYEGIGRCYSWWAWYAYEKGDVEKLLEYSLKSVDVFEHHKNDRYLGRAYLNLGSGYKQTGDSSKEVEYKKKALAIFLQGGDKLELESVYYNLANYYMDHKNNKTAMIYLHKCLTIDKEPGHQQLDLVYDYTSMGTIYTNSKKYDSAIYYYNLALAIAKKYQSAIQQVAIAYEGLMECYGFLGNNNKAAVYADSSLVAARKTNSKTLFREFYLALSKFERARENYKAALSYSDLYIAYRDSAITENKAKQFTELETKYQSEKKEQAIKLLEQENKLESLTRNWLLSGFGAVLVMGGVVFYFQRQRSRRNQELLQKQQELNRKLQEADELKSRFFAYVSHEFRTPLTLLLGPLEEELKKTSHPTEEKETLKLMQRNANRLLELVNQLLDLSKLETGKMKLQVRHQLVDQVLKAIASSFDSWAEHKQVHFVKHIQLPALSIWCDIDSTEKIINNLLSNGFKFTPAQGTVTLIIDLIKDRLCISVSDTGKGIAEEEQEEVFSPFYQIRQAAEGRQEGTGLGLSLVKELVKLYGGTISLHSKQNEGTTVRVELPTSDEQFLPEQRSEPVAEELHNLHSPTTLYDDDGSVEHEHTLRSEIVLVVEDNADMRKFMTTILESEYEVLLAQDGEEGVKLAMSALPNLVLSDLMMPKMDGIQLTNKIKNEERTSHIPVILLTAKNELESRLTGLITGADDYLTKPFSNEELKVRIRNLIQQRKRLAEKFKERILVMPTPHEEQSLDVKFLFKARQVVEKNLEGVAFGVEQMAEEMGFSRTHLLRKIKALTNISPNEFIRDLRLNKAAEMIRQKADTVSQIAYAVGFSDQSYFAKCFKRKFGKSPSEY